MKRDRNITGTHERRVFNAWLFTAKHISRAQQGVRHHSTAHQCYVLPIRRIERERRVKFVVTSASIIMHSYITEDMGQLFLLLSVVVVRWTLLFGLSAGNSLPSFSIVSYSFFCSFSISSSSGWAALKSRGKAQGQTNAKKKKKKI